jgi:hypothetical protein
MNMENDMNTDIEYRVLFTKKGFKVNFKKGKKRWFGDYIHNNNCSWNQWGGDTKNLGETVPYMEKFLSEWFEQYEES